LIPASKEKSRFLLDGSRILLEAGINLWRTEKREQRNTPQQASTKHETKTSATALLLFLQTNPPTLSDCHLLGTVAIGIDIPRRHRHSLGR